MNPNATAGDASAQGWDAVTIPRLAGSGGPAYGGALRHSGFPKAAGAWPASCGQVFAGGAGGTARLTQSLSLLQPSGRTASSGTRYQSR